MNEINTGVTPAPHKFIGTPSYYLWRHSDFMLRNFPEPAPDYYIDYGFKYAQRFQEETINQLSAQGQIWVCEVMTCLQILMEKRLLQSDGKVLESNPKALRDFAFSAHVEAYWNKEGTAPLYTLPFSDLPKILFTPDFRDLIRAKSLWQIATIMCKLGKYRLAQLFNRTKKDNCHS